MDYEIDSDAPKLDLLGETKRKAKDEPKAVICSKDQTEMNYHIATDQWQCPQCGAVSHGGKPQSEKPDEPSDPIHPGTS